MKFVQSFSGGTIRTSSGDWVGFQGKVGKKDLVVSALARWILIGNSEIHLINLLDAAGNLLEQVSLNAAGQTTDSFAWVSLASPIRLSAGSTFYLISQEPATPDIWLADDLVFQATIDAAVLNSVYTAAANGLGIPSIHNPQAMYGPLNFQYPDFAVPQMMVPN